MAIARLFFHRTHGCGVEAAINIHDLTADARCQVEQRNAPALPTSSTVTLRHGSASR
jgi:hypothetical protein